MSFGLLKGKVVAVTGCSTGIGRAIAIGAARNGANLVLHHLGDDETRSDIAQVESACHDLGAKTVIVPGDISDAQTASAIVSASVSSFSRLDILISNAGICPFHSFLDLPHPLWHRTQNVNLNGAFYAVQAAANQMASQSPKGGSIVAVSSISALMGGGEQCHYTPTKAGVKSLMESCAIALGPMGIRCNSVLPGTIETNINKADLANPSKRADQLRRIPLSRLGQPEDLVGPALFFASDLSGYCTGASVLVDGGMAISLQ